jgi:hypothetical protein
LFSAEAAAIIPVLCSSKNILTVLEEQSTGMIAAASAENKD